LTLAATTTAPLEALLVLLSTESTVPSLFAARDCEAAPIEALKHKAINVRAFEYDMSLNPVSANGQAWALQHAHSAWTRSNPRQVGICWIQTAGGPRAS